MELRRNGIAIGAVILVAALILISITNPQGGSGEKRALARNEGARDCGGLASPALDICVMDSIEAVIAERGIAGGLDFFLAHYQKMGECHQLAHRVGEASYEAYASGERVSFGPGTAFCGWGFWHGFATRFSRATGGNYGAAQKFCADIDSYGVAGIDSCFHGIGIGLVPDPPQPRMWGDPVAVADQAADNCDMAKHKRKDYMDCLAGAFHGVFDYMKKQQYGLRFKTEEPFQVCQAQESRERKNACYSQIMPLATSFSGDSIEEFLQGLLDADRNWIAMQPEWEPYVTLIATTYPPFVKGRDLYSPQTLVTKCRQFPGQFQIFCIRGMARGHFATGSMADGEYRAAKKFCNAPGLTDMERTECVKAVVRAGYEFYTPQDAIRVCGEIVGGADALCEEAAAKRP